MLKLLLGVVIIVIPPARCTPSSSSSSESSACPIITIARLSHAKGFLTSDASAYFYVLLSHFRETGVSPPGPGTVLMISGFIFRVRCGFLCEVYTPRHNKAQESLWKGSEAYRRSRSSYNSALPYCLWLKGKNRKRAYAD